jgi:hypothetical protein
MSSSVKDMATSLLDQAAFARPATRCQASTRRWKREAMSPIAASSEISPFSQRRAASLKMVRPTAKPLTCGSLAAAAKAASSSSSGASSPSRTMPRH